MAKYQGIARVAALAAVLTALVACSAPQRPILYPNQKLKQVGVEASKQDIEKCREMASAAGASAHTDQSEKAAKSGVKGGAIGGAVGAATGAIAGRPGRGALIGAVGGAVAGATKELVKDGKPSKTYKLFVNRCLEDEGYEVLGWE